MIECSNCGKSDKLHDEGDTFYCSHCAQRTLESSGEIYLTLCPECGEMTRGEVLLTVKCVMDGKVNSSV